MKVVLTPEEIIKTCLWDSYVYYILKGSSKEAERILRDETEIVLNDKEALVLGLFKTIETTNLVHKFNTYIKEVLSNKTLKKESTLLIRKKILDAAIDSFLDKFPDYWTPNSAWITFLKDLVDYIDDFKNKIAELETIELDEKGVIYECYQSNVISKLLTYKYY